MIPEPKLFTMKRLSDRWEVTYADIRRYGMEKQVRLIWISNRISYSPTDSSELPREKDSYEKSITIKADDLANVYYGYNDDKTRFFYILINKENYPGVTFKNMDPVRIKLKDISIPFEDISKLENENPVSKRVKHTSELLDFLDQLIDEFWVDYDPKNPPTNDAMMAWLADKNDRFCTNINGSLDKDKPNQLAKYLSMITRPDDKK